MTQAENLIDRLAAIDTPTLSNAIEKLEVRSPVAGFWGRDMRCLFPDLGVMCGYAVTAQVETMNPDEPGRLGQAWWDVCQAVQEKDAPTVVVMQEIGPAPGFSTHCGEVMATTFQRLGAVGVVSDSGVRDLSEVHALGFRYFAPGCVPSHANFRLVRAQVPVSICGVEVSPGDLLHGDANGLIKVPEHGRDRLPELAAAVTRAEKVVLDFVKGNDFNLDGLRERMRH